MEQHIIKKGHLEEFMRALRVQERSPGTIEKYRRDVGNFAGWLNGAEVTRERTAA